MAKTNNLQFNKSPKLAYTGFLFQTFLKRPFGYIIGVLYVVYLAVILLIVPAAVKQHPLFIWNISAFNMPIFNLFFIAAATSSAAVAIFRIGREDGTDLALSAKPLTKGNTVAIKTIVYITVMLVFCLIALFSVVLILPVFGNYDILLNPTGISMSQYKGVILSVTIGNIVNMFVFGAISIFICMVGGQVITMIGTIAFAFVLCMMNFIYPRVVTSASDYIEKNCNSQLLSFNANTIEQYNHPDEIGTKPYEYTAIQCYADGSEEITFDTKEYWDIARSKTGTGVINYVDLGKQLSSLYSSFGLEGLKLEDAKQLFIDCSPEYNYNVIANTSPRDPSNISAGNCPICIYDIYAKQGKVFPLVRMVGTDVAILDTDNWYIQSKYRQVDFDSIGVLSKSPSTYYHPTDEEDRKLFENKTWFKINELIYTDEQKAAADALWEEFWVGTYTDAEFSQQIVGILKTDQRAKILFDGETFESLSELNKFKAVNKLHLYWAIKAQTQQRKFILTKAGKDPEDGIVTSEDVLKWYEEDVASDPTLLEQNKNLIRVINDGFSVGVTTPNENYYSKLVTSYMEYAETYTNLYQYQVTSFYSLPTLISIWSIISVILLSSSIVVYKRTDFK